MNIYLHHCVIIKDLEAKHDKEISELKGSQEKEITRLKETHEDEVLGLKEKLDAVRFISDLIYIDFATSVNVYV